jgi:hypothetical protein
MSALTRRGFLAGAAAAASALVARPDRAVASSATFDGTICVLGLPYFDMIGPIPERAQQDLGVGIVSTAESPFDIQLSVRQEPATWDVFSCFQQDVAELWTSRHLQPVEIARIERWKEITPLYKLGKVRPNHPRSPYGLGEAAFRRLYVDPERSGRWRSAPGVASSPSLKRLLVQWVDESTSKRVGPEPKFLHGRPRHVQLRLLRLQL